MMHEDFLKKALNYYEARRHAEKYLFGWHDENSGNLLIIALDTLPIEMLGVTKESGTDGLRVRVRANSNTLKQFKTRGAKNLGAWAKWVEEYHKRAPGVKKDNRGDIVECAIRLSNGYEWTRQGNKSSIPFDSGADVIINGVKFEVKSQEATLIGETFMRRHP